MNKQFLERSMLMADLSRLAYDKPDQAKNSITGRIFRQILFFTGKSTQVYVLEGLDQIVVAFRGTQPYLVADWLRDLDFTTMNYYDPLRVHQGFWQALEEVYGDVVILLKELAKNKPIAVTGHSLGGALAVLFAKRLSDETYLTIEDVYTFGQPRVGNTHFAKVFEKQFAGRYFRFVNYNDIVPQVPPPGYILGYRHSNAPWYFNKEGHLLEKPSVRCTVVGAVIGLFQDIKDLKPGALERHGMHNYRSNLRREIYGF